VLGYLIIDFGGERFRNSEYNKHFSELAHTDVAQQLLGAKWGEARRVPALVTEIREGMARNFSVFDLIKDREFCFLFFKEIGEAIG
jgi:hypothetical protein